MLEVSNAWYRVSVKGIVYSPDGSGKIMLCKEQDGTRDLPGGGLDRGEDPVKCLHRELIEEMGLHASSINDTPVAFIATEKPGSKKRPRISNVCFEVTLESFDFKASDECVEIGFFDAEGIKEIKVLPNVLKVFDQLFQETESKVYNNGRMLVLRCHYDICDNEPGVLEHRCGLLNIEFVSKDVHNVDDIESIVSSSGAFNYIYLCSHGNKEEFSIQLEEEGKEESMKRYEFGALICDSQAMSGEGLVEGLEQDGTLLFLACCKGGLRKVALELMTSCPGIEHVCGPVGSVNKFDITTSLVVLMHHVVNKLSDKHTAVKFASEATGVRVDYHLRDELEGTYEYDVLYSMNNRGDLPNWDDPRMVEIRKSKKIESE